MEGQQSNVQVSGNQSFNPEISVRPRIPRPPKNYDPNVYDISVDSDDGHDTRQRKGQRGAQARGARSGPGQRGSAKRGRPAGGSKTVNTRLRENTANSARNKDINKESDSENEIDKVDYVQLECLEEKVYAEKKQNEWYADNMYTVIETIFQVLPSEAINKLKHIAIENKDSQRHTWLNDCIANIRPERFTEAREAATINSGTRTNASENEEVTDVQREEVATSNITRENVRHIVHQETNVILETIEDKKRKKNLIVIGMEEGYDDQELVIDMFRQLECNQAIQDIVSYPTRLGTAKWGRRRPMKVELRTERAVEYIINNKKWLKQTRDYFRVYINRDLNRQDRIKERDDRLKNKRNGNSGAEDSLPGGRGATAEPTAEESQHSQGTQQQSNGNNQIQNGMSNAQRNDENTPTTPANQQSEPEVRGNNSGGGGGGEGREEGVGNSTSSPRANAGEEERVNVGGGEEGVIPGLVNTVWNGLSNFATAMEDAITPKKQGKKESRVTGNTVEESAAAAEGTQNASNSGNRAEGGKHGKNRTYRRSKRGGGGREH